MQNVECAFIVGANLSSIIADIRRDRAWRRLGLASWVDEDGRHVRYMADPALLHGTYGACVYFAPGYDKHCNWLRIHEMIEARDCERVDL